MSQDYLLKSLSIICRLHGKNQTPEALKVGLPIKDGLMSLDLISRAMGNVNILVKERFTKNYKLPTHITPALLVLKEGRYCILVDMDVKNRVASVIYPHTNEVNIQSVSLKSIFDEFSGTYFIFKNEYEFDSRAPNILSTNKKHWFWSTIWLSKVIYRDVLIASLFINLFALAMPIFTRVVYDKVLPNYAFDTLWVVSFGLILVLLSDLVLKSLRSYFIDVAGKKSDVILSSRLFSKVLGIKLEAKPISTGAFAKHIQEFEYVRDFITSASITALIDLPFGILFLVMIWFMGGELVLVPLVGTFLLLGYSTIVQHKLRATIEESNRLSTQKNAVLIEALVGIEGIKSQSTETVFQGQWEESIVHSANWNIKSKNITDTLYNISSFLQQVINVGIIIFGIYLISVEELTMGGLIAATMLSSRAVAPLVQIAILSTKYNQAKSSLKVIEEIMLLPDEQELGKHYISHPIIQGKIDVENLSFSYQNSNTPVLDNISLSIRPGEKVALLGHIGSGKSTFLKLLMGLYEPSEGTLKIDNVNVKQLQRADIRKNIGYAAQEPTLFFGSIRKNISIANPLIENKEILKAANRSGLLSFIQHDDEGLERLVGEQGQLLSGGQKQCIALARAFLGEPNVILLDEPTSAIDLNTETHIKKEISKLKDKTIIITTHKSSLLDIVDRIIVFDKGRIVADGDKGKIMNNTSK